MNENAAGNDFIKAHKFRFIALALHIENGCRLNI